MKRDGTAGDTENAADLPGGCRVGGPPGALQRARRQRHARDDALAGKLAPGVRVEKERQELQHLGTRLDIAAEGGPALVGRKGDGGDDTPIIVDRNGEPAADAEGRRLVQQLLLLAREPLGPTAEAPLEGLRRTCGLADYGIDAFVAACEVVAGPGDRVAGDELRLAAAGSRRQGQVGEAGQLEGGCNVRHRPVQVQGIDAFGETVDERLEGAMPGALADRRLEISFAGVAVGQAPGAARIQDLPTRRRWRSEEPTSELQYLMHNSYADLCLQKTTKQDNHNNT